MTNLEVLRIRMHEAVDKLNYQQLLEFCMDESIPKLITKVIRDMPHCGTAECEWETEHPDVLCTTNRCKLRYEAWGKQEYDQKGNSKYIVDNVTPAVVHSPAEERATIRQLQTHGWTMLSSSAGGQMWQKGTQRMALNRLYNVETGEDDSPKNHVPIIQESPDEAIHEK